MEESRVAMEEGEEAADSPQVSCRVARSPLTAASYSAIPSSDQRIFWRLLGILGAVILAHEGGAGGGAGGRVNSVKTMSCRESTRGFSTLHTTLQNTSLQPCVLVYRTMSRSESKRPSPTKW